jgi:hypothetical protein
MNQLALIERFPASQGMQFKISSLNNGIQVLIRFPNGAGVSVVRHDLSYGGNQGLWEAAPVMYLGEGWEWDFIGQAFDLPGFADRDDVAGWLTESDVDAIIEMVANL